MASITIRNLDESLKKRLKIQAARHGRSMEGEAREILKTELARIDEAPNLAEAIHALFKPLGGVDLPEYRRSRAQKRPAAKFE